MHGVCHAGRIARIRDAARQRGRIVLSSKVCATDGKLSTAGVIG